jgi:hypothetical protein
MTSGFLTAISILLAILVAYFFVQFRTEYNLSQLSPSPSPFLKLKSSFAGPSSQTERTNPVPEKAKVVPDPEVLQSTEGDYHRPTTKYNDYPVFAKDDPRRRRKDSDRKDRVLDPEYEMYAQQLQAVLGNLKEAVKKIDESANITEIAGLVKMKPNQKDEPGELKIEEDHNKLLEEDENDRNTFIGKQDRDREATETDTSAKTYDDLHFEQTKKYMEDLLKMEEEEETNNSPKDEVLPSQELQSEDIKPPIQNPYDAIMKYRNTYGKRDQDLVQELEDKVVNRKGEREAGKILKELNDAKKERFELMEHLVDYYFQEVGDNDNKLKQEHYEGLTEIEKTEFRTRLQDTLFGKLVLDGEEDDEDEDEIYEDMDEEEGVYDERLGGNIARDAKELLDEIPEVERDWIYDKLRFKRKMEKDIKDSMIEKILEDMEKSEEKKVPSQ